jgi:hypothetical protein
MKTLKIVAIFAIVAFVFCALRFWAEGNSLLISLKNAAIMAVGLVSVTYAIIRLLVGSRGLKILHHDFKFVMKR